MFLFCADVYSSQVPQSSLDIWSFSKATKSVCWYKCIWSYSWSHMFFWSEWLSLFKNTCEAHMCSDLWRLSWVTLTQMGYKDHMIGGASAWYQTWDPMTTIGRWLKEFSDRLIWHIRTLLSVFYIHFLHMCMCVLAMYWRPKLDQIIWCCVTTSDNIVPGMITHGITAGSSREFRFIKLFFLFKILGYKLSRPSGVWPWELVLWYSESCGRATRIKNTLKRQGQHVIATSASLHTSLSSGFD